MSYRPSREQLRGLSYDKAHLYGMPHIGCKYGSEDINDTEFDGDYMRCACCGRTNWVHNRHHEPPKSNGSFLLVTPKGKFTLLPALIDLCGSGSMGCHGLRHNNELEIRWEWDSDEYAEMWWDGTFLSKGLAPHGEWLYGHGRYVFDLNGVEWEFRG